MLFDCDESEQRAKEQFAKQYSKNQTLQNANEIAFKIFSEDCDVWKAVKIASEWPNDPSIIELMGELKSRSFDDEELLRAKMVKNLIEIFEDKETPPKDRVAAIDKLAELQGLKIKKQIEDEEGGLNFVYFPVAQNIDEWEEESMKYQADLKNKVFG